MAVIPMVCLHSCVWPISNNSDVLINLLINSKRVRDQGAVIPRDFWLTRSQFDGEILELLQLTPDINPTSRRSAGVALLVCFCVMSCHQMLQQNSPPLKMKAGPSLIAAGGGPFYGAPQKSQRLSLKHL